MKQISYLSLSLLFVSLVVAGYGTPKGDPINPRDVAVSMYRVEIDPAAQIPAPLLSSIGNSLTFSGRDANNQPTLLLGLSAEGSAVGISVLSLHESMARISSPTMVPSLQGKMGSMSLTDEGNVWGSDAAKQQLVKIKLPDGTELERRNVAIPSTGIAGIEAVDTDVFVLSSKPDASGIVLLEKVSAQPKASLQYRYQIDWSRYKDHESVALVGLSAIDANQFLTIERGIGSAGTWMNTLYLIDMGKNPSTEVPLRKLPLIDLSKLNWSDRPIAAITLLDDKQTVVVSSGLTGALVSQGRQPIELWFVTLPGALVSSTFVGYIAAIASVLIGSVLLAYGLKTKPPYKRQLAA